MKIPVSLTIAGSDSGGGAGIQADLKTFSALGTFGCSVITAVTAQNTTGVYGIHEIPLDIIESQIDAVLNDLNPNVIKTGMLASIEVIKLISEKIKSFGIFILRVLVIFSTSASCLFKYPEYLSCIATKWPISELAVIPKFSRFLISE